MFEVQRHPGCVERWGDFAHESARKGFTPALNDESGIGLSVFVECELALGLVNKCGGFGHSGWSLEPRV